MCVCCVSEASSLHFTPLTRRRKRLYILYLVFVFACVCASVSAYLTMSSDSFNQTLVFLLSLIMHNLMMQRALLFVLKYCGEVELLKLFLFSFFLQKPQHTKDWNKMKSAF